MDDSTRAAIVSGATAAAGPISNYIKPEPNEKGEPVLDHAAWMVAVTENAVAITAMVDENSSVSRAIAQVADTKAFVGTVVAVKRETSSTRGLVTLHTGTDRAKDGVPAGCEMVRTERTDNPMGLSMARKVRALVGHKILVRVQVEEYNGGQGKVRVLRYVEDLGVDADAESKLAG